MRASLTASTLALLIAVASQARAQGSPPAPPSASSAPSAGPPLLPAPQPSSSSSSAPPPLPAPPWSGTSRAPAPSTSVPPPPPPPPAEPEDAAAAPPPAPAAAPAPPPKASGDEDDEIEPDDQLRAIGEPETDPTQHRYFPINFSFLYPLSTSIGDPNRATNLDIGIVYTKVGYLYGVQTGVLAGVSQRMTGVQIGLGAVSEGRTDGAQLAGAFALSDAPFNGLQIAGVFAWGRFRFNGVQIAGAATQARKHFAGLQLAGGVNIARKTLHGAQIAGVMNIGAVEGLQIAPLNISSEVNGVQIGLINIARKVRGIQIGLINVADDLSGESIGMASVPRSGGIHGAVWGSNSLYGNFGVKFASHYTYSLFSGSFHFENDGKEKLFAPGFTFGLFHPIFLENLFLSGDIGGYRLFRLEGGQRAHDELFKARILVRYAVVRHLSLFAGGGAFVGFRSGDDGARWGPEFDAGLEL